MKCLEGLGNLLTKATEEHLSVVAAFSKELRRLRSAVDQLAKMCEAHLKLTTVATGKVERLKRR